MTRVQHILCPTDFSDCSRQAIAVAGNLAAQFGADLTVAHVYSMALPLLGNMAALAGPVRLDAAEAARFEGDLGRLTAPARQAGVATRTVVVEGDPCTEIVALSESLGVDMVVMGTHGRSGLDRWVLGSVAERVVHRVRCPVVTIAEGGAPPRPGNRIKKILCAESLWKHSRTVECALSLARRTEASLVVFHAVEELSAEAARGGAPFEYGPGLIAAAAERLWAMIPAADQANDRVQVSVVPGRAREQILKHAARDKPDLIIMGVHARNPFDLAVWGSTVRQVVRHAECPVMTVHGGARLAWTEQVTGEVEQCLRTRAIPGSASLSAKPVGR